MLQGKNLSTTFLSIVVSKLCLLCATILLISCNDDILNTPATVEDPNDLQLLTEEGAELAFQLFTVTPVTDAQAYKLEIASDILFTDRLFSRIDYPGPELAGAADLEADTTYYWRASVRKDGTWGYPSEGRSFRMVNSYSGFFPADESFVTDLTPDLSWNPISGAFAYEVRYAYSEEELFAATVEELFSSSWEVTVPVEVDNNFYWQLRVKNVDGAAGAWSGAKYFTVVETLPIPTDGLIGEYLFNGNAEDSSGNGNHGTVHGATLVADRNGRTDQAYQFNGIDNHISLPLIYNGVPESQYFTITVWYRSDDEAGALITNGDAGDGAKSFGLFTYAFSIGGVGGLGYGYREESLLCESSNWCFLSMSYNNSDLVCYINGIEIYREEIGSDRIGGVGNYGRTDQSPYSRRLSVGVLNNAFNYDTTRLAWFEGMIDDIRIYNRALTAEEVSSLFHYSR